MSEKAKVTATRRSPLVFILLVLGILLVLAYIALPLINQPELGATTATTVLESRSNNEFGIVTGGLVMIPLSGMFVILLGIWGIIAPHYERVVSFGTALAGLMSLLYFFIFAKDYSEYIQESLEEVAAGDIPEVVTYMESMGIGFWVMLILSILLTLQVLLPRARALPKYRIGKVFGNQEGIILFGLLGIAFIVGLSNPRFLAERNISDVLQGHAYIAVAAIGMSMVIITGNIDISVGSLIAALAILSGRIAVDTGQIALAWIIPVLVAMLIEGGIGFLVAYFRIPSIVVTLGMLSIVKGILIILTNGERVTDLPEPYLLAQMRPLGIPMPIILMIILTILAAIWMRYSGIGRSFYAVGGNAEAARLSGLSERRVIMQVFILNGFFVGIASLLYATQLNIIQATPPLGLELLVITASVVGGVSILGGTGTVIGSTLAAILLNAIRSALVFIGLSPFLLKAVQGVLILLTVLADIFQRQGQSALTSSSLRLYLERIPWLPRHLTSSGKVQEHDN